MDEQLDKSKTVLETMRSRFDTAISTYSSSRMNQLSDLKFYAGSPDNAWQWPVDVKTTRTEGDQARPCITINKLPQHVKQVTNDQRQNRPSGKAIPADDKADIKLAEIYDGMVRHIQNTSDADIAIDTACDGQVVQGEGYIRLTTDYCDEMSFDQEIKINRVRNPFSVFLDPAAQDPCGADAEWGFTVTDLTKDQYARDYPKAQPISSIQSSGVNDSSLSNWLNNDMIKIVEYFYAEYTQVTINLYSDGSVIEAGTEQDKQAMMLMGKPQKTRKTHKRTIKWIKSNGYEILEEKDWLGKWIPIIRVVGNEHEVEGEIHISGLVRNAKDAQRMYNYWVSQEAEMLALAPKAPFVGYGGQFEGYEQQWRTANTKNHPYLEVNASALDGQGAVLPLPQRALPPMASSGILQAKSGASEDIKASTGQYNASLGLEGNERSGKAIMARQREGDTGTYHYVDNLSRAIRHMTRQIIDLVPKIYDTERIARIMGEDGKQNVVNVNPDQQEAVKQIKNEFGDVVKSIYNLNVGKYDVIATTGPSYTTKRQEGLEAMTILAQTNPKMWDVTGDLILKSMDVPGSQEMSERWIRTIDPVLLDKDNPVTQAANRQIQELEGRLKQTMGMLKAAENSIEIQELELNRFKIEHEAEVKEYEAETRRLSVMAPALTPQQIQQMIERTIQDTLSLSAKMPEQQPQQKPESFEQQPEQEIAQMPEGEQ